jgi:hypothetical protein
MSRVQDQEKKVTELYLPLYLILSRIASGNRLDGWISIPGRSKRSLFSPQCPERLCGPPNLLSDVHLGLFPLDKMAGMLSCPIPSSAEVMNGGGMPPLPHTSSWHLA